MTETYEINYEPENDPLKRRFRFLYGVVQSAIVWWLLSLIPWFRTPNKSVIVTLVEGLFFGTFLQILFPFALTHFRHYALRVTDDSLTADYGYYKRTIHRYEVRTVKERSESVLRPAALMISKYGSFGTRMWGFIWIPRGCAKYEEIRELALEWQRETIERSA